MAKVSNSTISQLLKIYQKSRMNGEQVSLSLEAKDGNYFILFFNWNFNWNPSCRKPSWNPAVKMATSLFSANDKENTFSDETRQAQNRYGRW